MHKPGIAFLRAIKGPKSKIKHCLVFFCDFDDTLYVPESPKTTKRNLQAIDKLRRKGHIVVLITARSYNCLLMDMRDISKHVDYIVANDGAVIYTINRGEAVTIYQDVLDNQLLGRFGDEIFNEKKVDGYEVVSYCGDKELDGFIPGSFKVRIWTKETKDAEAIHALVQNKFKGELSSFIYPNVPERRHHDAPRLMWVDYDHNNAVDVYNINTNKGAAVKRLLEHIRRQLPSDTTIRTAAAGDHYNDVTMLEGCDLSFVMSKGRKEVKALAKKEHNITIVPNAWSAIAIALNPKRYQQTLKWRRYVKRRRQRKLQRAPQRKYHALSKKIIRAS